MTEQPDNQLMSSAYDQGYADGVGDGVAHERRRVVEALLSDEVVELVRNRFTTETDMLYVGLGEEEADQLIAGLRLGYGVEYVGNVEAALAAIGITEETT